jgi:hypothetical protein
MIPAQQGVMGNDRYAYTNNNPVNYADPSGHAMTECGPDGQDCGASQAQIAYETKRYYYENCSSGYGGGCPDYGEAIAFTALGLLLAGSAEVIFDAVGTYIIEAIATLTDIGEVPENIEPPAPINIDPPALDNSLEPGDYPTSAPGSKGDYESPYGFPGDPTKPPADGFSWNGQENSIPGSRQGNWYNEDTREWFHWESDSPSHGQHWDYSDPWGRRYRIFPDGSMEPK